MRPADAFDRFSLPNRLREVMTPPLVSLDPTCDGLQELARTGLPGCDEVCRVRWRLDRFAQPCPAWEKPALELRWWPQGFCSRACHDRREGNPPGAQAAG